MKATFEDSKSDGMDIFLPHQLRKKLEKNSGDTDLVELLTHLVSLRKRMSAYIPDFLSSMISEQPVPGKSSITINRGSLVFADVSGFTSMSEKLSALGKEGAEEITLIVNNYFERMIAISQEYSGDLIKFGGDALILFYTGEHASLRGLQSAVAMQDAMDEFKEVKTSQGVSHLKMSIGIATGLVYMIGMGSEEKMDYLAAGSTLERMDKAESISQAEQIVIDTETYNHVESRCIFSEVEPGYWLLNQINNGLTGLAADQNGKGSEVEYEINDLENLKTEINILKAIKPYIPSALFDHLVIAPHGDAYQGGHRPVTVLFAHFYGINELIHKIGKEKPEVILEVIETYYYNMAQVIAQFGGTISRVDSYKSGHRILALFGALRAHEDDHQRAVQTAWEMNKRLTEINSAVQEIMSTEPDIDVTIGHRIGINTGFVFASDVGASSRREYTVMGDQVNLTARLMSAAEPGEILIGETTANRLESNIILEEKPPIMVKGKSHQVKRYALVDIQQEDRTLSGSANPLVGRDVELSLGKESVDKAENGIFSAFIIRGDSGIGKTRLSQEMISYANQRNLSVISSHSQSFSKSMPYSTWIQVFNQIFGIETGKSSQGADLVRNALKEIDSEVWSPLFGSIIGADIPESRMTRILEGKVRKQKIFDLTIQLLAYQAEKNPFVLFLDDLQWADPVSLELFLHVISHMPPKPLLLLGTHRMDKGMPEWSEYSRVLDIELTELPDYATIQIAKQVVGGIILPEPVLAYILEKTSGNPLFIQETMRALQAEGLLAEDDSASVDISETLENLELPDTIHGLVISRIDRLPIESRYLLQLASITGVDFSLSFLEGAFNLGQSKLATITRLDQLVEMGVLDVRDVDSYAYRFQHLTTRDVVYDTLPYKERRKMHNQCGIYLESNLDFTGGERIDLMAFHFFEGQSWEKAIDYNLQAGERAKNIFANESAIDAFHRVLEAVSSGENGKQYQAECCSVREALGEVYTLVGMYDHALENFRYSLDNMCGEPGEREPVFHAADLSRKIADVFERQSEHDDAFAWITKGLEQISASPPSLERAKLYLLGAGLYHRKGDNQLAAAWCDHSIADSKSLSSDEAVQAQAQAFYLLGAIEARNGNLTEAVEFCEKSKELYQQINDVLGEARAWNNMGVALTDMGDWNEATEALENSLEINQQIGNIHEEGFGANNLGNIYLYKGDWEKALRFFRQSNSIWKRIGALLPDAVTLSNQAQAHIYLKNWNEAEKLLEKAERMFLQVGSDDFTPEVERRWGELKFKTGDLDSAKNHLTKSLEIANEHNAQLEIAITSQILGEVLLDQGEIDVGEKKLEESLKMLIEIESDYEAARTRVALARLRIQQGILDEARDLLRQSEATFKQSGAEVDLRITLELIGKLDE